MNKRDITKKAVITPKTYKDVDTLVEKLKEEITARTFNYEKAIKDSRPILNAERTLQRYSKVSSITSKRIASLVMKQLSLATAFDYAKTMLMQDIDADGIELDENAILSIGRKTFKYEITKIVLNHYKIPQKEKDLILNLTREKEYKTPQILRSIPLDSINNKEQATSTDEMKLMLSKLLERNINK